MATLYNLTDEMVQLMLLAEDPEASDINPEIFADTFEGLNMEYEEKLEAYGMVIKQVESDSEALDAEIKRLQARKRSCDNSVVRMKEAVKTSMIRVGKPKVKTTLFTFGVQRNPPKMVKDCEDYRQFPPELRIQRDPEVDWVKVRQYLNKPDEYPFLKDLVHMEQGESLRIR